jgi:hypothetical protein
LTCGGFNIDWYLAFVNGKTQEVVTGRELRLTNLIFLGLMN